jgi:hypothetical protein
MKKYIITIAILVAFPVIANASTVYIESSKPNISVGDTAIITVKVNAEGAVLNTVEGEILIKSLSGGSVSVQEFSLANSSFGLWPRTPSLSTDGNLISFVGGVPGGFSIEGATLFKIIVEAKKEGTITITPQNMVTYLNDGKGGKVPVKQKPISIKIDPAKQGVPANNEWNSIIASDVNPPEDFIIIIGQDKALFDGKKFAFFSALDNQSGISHYDVSEDGAPSVRSGSTYVLKNQSDSVRLSVTAYDKANNKKTANYPVSESFFSTVSWSFVIVVIVLVIIIRFILRKLFR